MGSAKTGPLEMDTEDIVLPLGLALAIRVSAKIQNRILSGDARIMRRGRRL